MVCVVVSDPGEELPRLVFFRLDHGRSSALVCNFPSFFFTNNLLLGLVCFSAERRDSFPRRTGTNWAQQFFCFFLPFGRTERLSQSSTTLFAKVCPAMLSCFEDFLSWGPLNSSPNELTLISICHWLGHLLTFRRLFPASQIQYFFFTGIIALSG